MIQVHKVSPELTDHSQYINPNEIPASSLVNGAVIEVYPGTYDLGTVNWAGVSVIGHGNPANIVLTNATIGNTASGTLSFTGVTFHGVVNATATSGSSALKIDHSAVAGSVSFKDCIFANADFAVDNQSTAKTLSFVGGSMATDRGVRSNAAASFKFAELNLTANAYWTAAATSAVTATVTASYSAGANAAGAYSLETVRALIS